MAQVTEISGLDKGLLLFGQVGNCSGQLISFFLEGENVRLIWFLIRPPENVLRFWPTGFAQRVNSAIACDGEYPCRRTCATWVKQMRLLLQGGHHVLCTFLGDGRIPA